MSVFRIYYHVLGGGGGGGGCNVMDDLMKLQRLTELHKMFREIYRYVGGKCNYRSI